MKVKKVITLLLVTTMLATMFAGCASKAAKNDTNSATATVTPGDTETAVTATVAPTAFETTETGEPKVSDLSGTLTIWGRYDAGWEALNCIVAQQEGDPYYEFVHKYFPNVKFELVQNGSDLNAAIAAGNPPDIYFWEGDYSTVLDQANNQWAEPLNTYMANDPAFVNNFMPSAMKDMTYNDNVYALPYSVMPQTMLLNLDAFDRANVPYPDQNWTVDQFVEICKKLTNKSDPSAMKVAIARNIDDLDYIRVPSIFLAAYGVKGYKEENGQKLSNLSEDPNAITALEKYLEVQGSNYACTLSADDRSAMGLDGTQWDIDWTSGTAAIFPGVSAWAYNADNKTKESPFRQAFYGPLIGPEGYSGVNQTYVSYSMYAGSKNKELAWEYLKFMTSEWVRQNATAPNPDDATVTIKPMRFDENTYRFMCYGIPPFTTEYNLTGDIAVAYEGLKKASENPVNVPIYATGMVDLLKSVDKGEKQLVDALKEYDDYVNANNAINWNAYK